jgi:hypothetical protein
MSTQFMSTKSRNAQSGSASRSARPIAARRPAGRPVVYATGGTGAPRGRHPLEAGSSADNGQDIGIVGLVAAGLVTFLVVAALLGLAHLRAGVPVTEPMPTMVVAVRDGESLSDVARRVAPESGVGAAVDRIVTLNHMADVDVRPGQLLVVPTSER